MKNKRPENTTEAVRKNPLMAMIGSRGIEAQEARGQRQLVESTSFPTKGRQDAELIAMGFELGEPYSDDLMFRDAKLPAGWKKKASDHSMWSYIVDDQGRRRVAIFYKAAFYDRNARYHLEQRFVISKNYELPRSAEKEEIQHQVKDAGKAIYQTATISHEGNDWKERKAIEEKQKAECEAWLDENYPGHGDLVGDWSL